MRVMTLTFAVMLLFTAVGAAAQSVVTKPDPILARLSYQNWTVIDWRTQMESPHVCLAVYQNGYYQISRRTETGNQILEGTMPKDQLARLGTLLDKVDFQSVGGGIQYLQGAESLVIELLPHGKTKHYFWVNPDNRNPLPQSAVRIANWLEDFRAPGGTPFKHLEDIDIRICPSMNDNPLPLTSGLK